MSRTEEMFIAHDVLAEFSIVHLFRSSIPNKFSQLASPFTSSPCAPCFHCRLPIGTKMSWQDPQGKYSIIFSLDAGNTSRQDGYPS